MSRACLELRLGLLERRTGCESRHELVEPDATPPRHARRGRQVAYVDMRVPRQPDVVSAGALGSLKAPSSDADNAELAAVYPDCLAEHGGVPVEHVPQRRSLITATAVPSGGRSSSAVNARPSCSRAPRT